MFSSQRRDSQFSSSTDVTADSINHGIQTPPMTTSPVLTNQRMTRSQARFLASPQISSVATNISQENQNLCVMFTMVNPSKYEPLLKQLNIIIVNTENECDVLVTDQICRSTKFLCVLACGKPIVSTDWLEALQQSKCKVDPFKFLLKDKVGEKKYQFSLAKTVEQSAKQRLFQHYSILVTPNTSPLPDVLKEAILSSGGKYLKTSLVPRRGDTVLCVSVKKDEKMWPNLKKKYSNLRDVISVNGFATAIFQHSLNVKAYSLEK